MKGFKKLQFLIRDIYYNSIAAFLITIVLGYIDWYSGYELSFQFFYFIPLALMAYNEQRSRLFLIIGAIYVAFIWVLADFLSGHTYSSIGFIYWNALSRFIVFVFFSLFLNTIIKNKGQMNLTNTELNKKNRLIAESVDYAKHIQNSVIPDYKKLQEYFPESFLISIPKNVLSGDFFWSVKQNNKIILAMVDCTGHGIPGALLSVVGVILLNKVVIEQHTEKPVDILKEINSELTSLFKAGNEMVDDGMEISIVSYDIENMEMDIAQTSDSIIIINSDTELTDFQSQIISIENEQSLGQEWNGSESKYKIKKDTYLYMFTDGIPDQFGGEKNKKYGRQRLLDKITQIHQLPAQEQHEIMQKGIVEWKGKLQQTDDITLVGLKFKA